MIDLTALQADIEATIALSGLFPRVAWANKDAAPARPYLALDLASIDIQDNTLAQSFPVWRGTMYATVVIAGNQFDTDGQTLLRGFAELFASADRIYLADGTVVRIDGHPFPTRPYQDGADYRLPLQMKLRTDTP